MTEIWTEATVEAASPSVAEDSDLLIVDAQAHIWRAGKASAHHSRGRPDPFTVDSLQAEMRAAGVHCAVLAPPSWDPNGNAYCLEMARAFPGRFAVTGGVDESAPPDPTRIENCRRELGMHGVRLHFNTPAKQAHLVDGTVDWIWAAAERADVPVMLLIPGAVPRVAEITQRFPDLRVCVDHLGIPRGTTGQCSV